MFLQEELIFLHFVISKGNMKMDPSKVKSIFNWPTPISTSEVKIFHGLASFYRKFIRDFSGVSAPMIDTIRGRRKCQFLWIDEAYRSFDYLKTRVAQQPILVFPNFHKVFTIECDASKKDIGGFLSQEGRPMAFFSEKLVSLKKNTPHII